MGSSVVLLGLALIGLRWHSFVPALGLLSSQNGLVLLAGTYPGQALQPALIAALPLVPALALWERWHRR